MIYRIFQNLTNAPKQVHCAREDAGLILENESVTALEGLLHRLRAWLDGIDRNRRVEYENAKAIKHLRSLTDTQLRDIGLTRPDIERAVRFGREQL